MINVIENFMERKPLPSEQSNHSVSSVIDDMLIECRGINDEIARHSAIRTLQELKKRITK